MKLMLIVFSSNIQYGYYILQAFTAVQTGVKGQGLDQPACGYQPRENYKS